MAKDKKAKAGKAPKDTAGGAKKSRIPRPVQSRGLAWAGLLALIPIALMLMHGSLSLTAAAERAAIVLGGLMVLERFVVPVILAVFTSGRSFSEAPAASPDGPDRGKLR